MEAEVEVMLPEAKESWGLPAMARGEERGMAWPLEGTSCDVTLILYSDLLIHEGINFHCLK